MSILKELQEWYKSHCDGDWEHIYGVTIGTLDDPGWIVKMSLTDTLLENEDFETIKIEPRQDAPHHWLECYKDEKCDDFDGPMLVGNVRTI